MKRIKLLATVLMFATLSVSCKDKDGTRAPSPEAFTAGPGWDIYAPETPIFHYGPSIIINDDQSIDVWYAAPGQDYPGVLANLTLLYRDDGGNAPYTVNNGKVVAQKFTADRAFYEVCVLSPTWGNSPCSITFTLYAWNTDYATTLAGTKIATKTHVNSQDGSWLGVTNEDLFPAGTYIWVVDQGTTNESGIWYREHNVDNVVSYWNNGEVMGGLSWQGRIQYAKVAPPEDGATAYWDQVAYQRLTDGGRAQTPDQNVLKSTRYSEDQLSICDPGVFKYGQYYYIGYTSTQDMRGTDNNLYIARGLNPNGPWEKWNGTGWTTGTDVKPVVTYDGETQYFGAGEPCFVVLNDVVYMYYTWNDGDFKGSKTYLATADVTNPNWPGNIDIKGLVIDKSAIIGSDHCDVKYREDIGKFQAIHTAGRLSADSYIILWQSDDGINFTRLANIRGKNFQPYLHNCGWSGDAQGHIKAGVQQYIAYAYGPNWANWKTYWQPIYFNNVK